MPIFDIAIASLHLIFFDIDADVSIDDAAFTPLRPDLLRFAAYGAAPAVYAIAPIRCHDTPPPHYADAAASFFTLLFSFIFFQRYFAISALFALMSAALVFVSVFAFAGDAMPPPPMPRQPRRHFHAAATPPSPLIFRRLR
jgi:hypothetical protein